MRPDRHRLAEDADGWMFPEEMDALHRYGILAPYGHDLVEVGAYCGKSTIILGDAAQQQSASLWSVDWHRGSPEMQPGKENHKKQYAPEGYHDTLAAWRKNVVSAQLDETVIGVVGQSVPVAQQLSGPFGLVFIDANHGPPVLDDAEAWRGSLAVGGYLIFHDSSIGWVQDAVNATLKAGGYEFLEEIVEDMVILQCVS